MKNIYNNDNKNNKWKNTNDNKKNVFPLFHIFLNFTFYFSFTVFKKLYKKGFILFSIYVIHLYNM